MEFKQGTHVYTSDGKNVGSIDRVVLDPRTDEVTDLVVRKGWLLSEDKVIPVGLVETTAEDRVTLDKAEHDLPTLLKFQETYYAPAYDSEPRGGDYAYPEGHAAAPLYGYPPLGVSWWGGFGGDTSYGPFPATPEYSKRVQDNIPAGTVAVKEGARVLSLEGDHIGNVEEVFTDPATNRVTHLILSQGLLFKERKLIPTNWIKLAGEDDVMLTVKTNVVHNLPEYKV